ncbi:uncharacterized protein LOC116083129 [Mastomys coucha]|uniref:uncharacterized protein LOC116083129 n=1 Tax=Mastomys coucha TaxID=35658 RepID=UPI001261ED3E|nr:uncharacterized protein LOC116083129 [Mastomys coucha]
MGPSKHSPGGSLHTPGVLFVPPECQFTQVVTFYGLPSSPGRDLLWLPAPLSGGSDVATLQDGLYKGLEAAQPKPETWRLLGRPKLQYLTKAQRMEPGGAEESMHGWET